MYSIAVPDDKSRYRLMELANMFLRPSEFDMRVSLQGLHAYDFVISQDDDALVQAQKLYDWLSAATAKSLSWGVLTGVRPVKLLTELIEASTPSQAEQTLRNEYRVSGEKVELLQEVYETQQSVNQQAAPPSIALYIGIPFCPSRCAYCSFPSNVLPADGGEAYVAALFREMQFVREKLSEAGWHCESIYVGGGTPTSLNGELFEALMERTEKLFLAPQTKEFTVECGRPDTMTKEKLRSLRMHGATRISINPQSMSDATLEAIGRFHTAAEIEQAFHLAYEAGLSLVNADLIVGLPGEEIADFKGTLDRVLALDPANITIHALAVKRASRLIEEDPDVAFRQAQRASDMSEHALVSLRQKGYRPYYLYRQKHMAGNLENIGFAKPGTESLYNIRIMAENQSIVALGAGAISKMYYPEENRLERIPNVTNYEHYIERIDEMIDRKEQGMS